MPRALPLPVLVALTMLAFAANSMLNRLALADAVIGPTSFALIRIAAGAVMLLALVRMRKAGARPEPSGRVLGVLSLTLYMLGFSFAYVSLDTGTGALILFGGVQVTMFGSAVLRGEAIPPQRWAGAALAFAGLLWLLWPGGQVAPAALRAALMAAAAFGFGLYSLNGRRSGDPVAATATSFALSAPLALLVWLVLPDAAPMQVQGVTYALLSGAITSGLGYALWYSILPRLSATVAAVSQLTVPVIAALGGVLLLGEMVTLRLAIASLLVLGGVALSLRSGRPDAQP